MAIIFSITLIALIHTTVSMNNLARSSTPPTVLATSDIPMFLTITFDDALHGESSTETAKILNHVNRNNLQIPLVYFVSNEYSDYLEVQSHYLDGHEIAVHTVTHTTYPGTNMSKWYYEIKQSRDLLSTHADIPIDEITGFRAPFLEKSDNTYKVLTGLNPAFTYDSTVVSELDNGLFDWPYTFDNYEPFYPYRTGEGPQKSYPGLWEIPLYELYSDISTKTLLDETNIMDYTGSYTELLNAFKDNFQYRLDTNRAPMGLYFHTSWFSIENTNALNDFISWVLALPDTWIVTNKDVIRWINNPISKSWYTRTHNQQLSNGNSNFQVCNYAQGWIRTVESVCPASQPHKLASFYNNWRVHTDITISTNAENIESNIEDQCVNDNYETYNQLKTYCSDSAVSDRVKYNNNIYKCLWWADTNNIPGSDAVWLLEKECLVSVDSFVQGSIAPFGTVHVMPENILNIAMAPFSNEYEIESISVIVGSTNVYSLSEFFDDYTLNIDPMTNAGALMIPFVQIQFDAFEIEIRFVRITTQTPTMTPTKYPSASPSDSPTQNPTESTVSPSVSPSQSPTMPSVAPSVNPTSEPTTSQPTVSPTTAEPTNSPTLYPTSDPDVFALEIKYATLVFVVIGVCVFALVLLCSGMICWVMHRQRKKMKAKYSLGSMKSMSSMDSNGSSPRATHRTDGSNV